MAKVSGQRKIYEMINNRIVSLLERGEVPWRKSWASGEPVNFITKKPYRGINPFILISSGFSCPYWVSFKQVKGKGGMIKKGEKGFPVVFWKWIEVKDPDAESVNQLDALLDKYPRENKSSLVAFAIKTLYEQKMNA